MNNMIKFTKEDAKETLKKGEKKAEIILTQQDKMDEFIKRLDAKTKIEENNLENIQILMEMLKKYNEKTYTEISRESIITIITTLLYWLASTDVIPDDLPEGHEDDDMIMEVCLEEIKNDIEKYKENKWN